MDYLEIDALVIAMIKAEGDEIRRAAVKLARLKLMALDRQKSDVQDLLELAKNGNWKPILTEYANTVYEPTMSESF